MAVPSVDSTPTLLERFIGTLFGAAIGDALGAPVEGWPRETIRTGCGRITEFQQTLLGRGVVTDDTQMTLALAESIVQEGHFDPEHFSFCLGEWMRLHDEGIEAARGASKTVTLTTRALYRGTPWTETGQPSASNVPAVRVAPLALFHMNSSDEAFLHDVEDSCLPTNIDPLAIAGAKIMALAIRALLRAEATRFDVGAFLDYLDIHAQRFSPRLAEALGRVRAALSDASIAEEVFSSPVAGYVHPDYCTETHQVRRDPAQVLEEIGTGKFVLESIPAALYCFLQNPTSFESAVITAVNAGGDTDSIASMAGALSGAFNSSSAIPARFLTELEFRDRLMDLATALHDLAEHGEGGDLSRWSMTIQVTKMHKGY